LIVLVKIGFTGKLIVLTAYHPEQADISPIAA